MMKYSCRARRLEMATRSRAPAAADFGMRCTVPPLVPGGLGGCPPEELGSGPVNGTSILGNPVRRVEDPRILSGAAQYVADLALPGVLAAVFVRSTMAHARLESVDTGAAAKMPGVVAVYT